MTSVTLTVFAIHLLTAIMVGLLVAELVKFALRRAAGFLRWL